jgi:hypothetical protein
MVNKKFREVTFLRLTIHHSQFTPHELYLTLHCNEQPARYIKKEPAQHNRWP